MAESDGQTNEAEHSASKQQGQTTSNEEQKVSKQTSQNKAVARLRGEKGRRGSLRKKLELTCTNTSARLARRRAVLGQKVDSSTRTKRGERKKGMKKEREERAGERCVGGWLKGSPACGCICIGLGLACSSFSRQRKTKGPKQKGKAATRSTRQTRKEAEKKGVSTAASEAHGKREEERRRSGWVHQTAALAGIFSSVRAYRHGRIQSRIVHERQNISHPAGRRKKGGGRKEGEEKRRKKERRQGEDRSNALCLHVCVCAVGLTLMLAARPLSGGRVDAGDLASRQVRHSGRRRRECAKGERMAVAAALLSCPPHREWPQLVMLDEGAEGGSECEEAGHHRRKRSSAHGEGVRQRPLRCAPVRRLLLLLAAG